MKYYLALDLKDNEELIAAYEAYHKAVWPEIIAQIKATGIESCEIYRVFNRLVMVLETKAGFSFEEKAHKDALNPIVEKWETLMWQYQQEIPGTKPGEKWQLMKEIFRLEEF